MLHTGYGRTDFGTGLVVDGIGVNAANDFPGGRADPGRRIIAPLASTLVLDGEHATPWFALGTPGYPPPCITLVLLNALGYGTDVPAAVDAPRLIVDDDAPAFQPAWRSISLALESRIPARTQHELQDLDVNLRRLGPHDPATGRVQAISRDRDGRLTGVVDPRSSGQAAQVD